MSWAITAAVGTSVVSSYMANETAKDANKQASRSQQNQLNFEKQKYEDWKAIYGDVEANLSDYYNGLTPELYISKGLSAFQQERETAMQRVRETLAQRGIQSDSALAVSIEAQEELRAAETRASIRSEAELKTAEAKQGFLQIGLGQNPSAGLSNALANKASADATRSLYEQQQRDQAVAGTASLVTDLALQKLNSPSQPSANYAQPDYTGGTTGMLA